MHIMSYEETMSIRPYYVAEVKILRRLSDKEKMEIASEFRNASAYTFFEAMIIHDYLLDKDLKVKIYLSQFGLDNWQLRGYPIFKKGDKYLLFLGKDNPNLKHYTVYGGPNGVYDIKVEKGEKYLYKWLGNFPELNSISVEMGDEERVAYPNGKENRVVYKQKFKFAEFVERIQADHDSGRYKKD